MTATSTGRSHRSSTHLNSPDRLGRLDEIVAYIEQGGTLYQWTKERSLCYATYIDAYAAKLGKILHPEMKNGHHRVRLWRESEVAVAWDDNVSLDDLCMIWDIREDRMKYAINVMVKDGRVKRRGDKASHRAYPDEVIKDILEMRYKSGMTQGEVAKIVESKYDLKGMTKNMVSSLCFQHRERLGYARVEPLVNHKTKRLSKLSKKKSKEILESLKDAPKQAKVKQDADAIPSLLLAPVGKDIPDPIPEISLKLRIESLKRTTCRAVTGEDPLGFMYCGRPTKSGSVYCCSHHRIFTRPRNANHKPAQPARPYPPRYHAR